MAERDFHEVRRRVGLLFQDADDQLFCPTVAEDVAFGPLNLGVPRDRVRQVVAETLESVGLAGYENRITYKLSGGEKRLVALATVLAMQPEVLLLDEPVSGLDEQATERLTELFARLPHAMLVVSHQQEFCRRVADGTVTLVEGRIGLARRECRRAGLTAAAWFPTIPKVGGRSSRQRFSGPCSVGKGTHETPRNPQRQRQHRPHDFARRHVARGGQQPRRASHRRLGRVPAGCGGRSQFGGDHQRA